MNRKTAEWLISNNFSYLENGKSIFNALVILTAEGEKAWRYFLPRKTLKFKAGGWKVRGVREKFCL
jgi:hypothetical protein